MHGKFSDITVLFLSLFCFPFRSNFAYIVCYVLFCGSTDSLFLISCLKTGYLVTAHSFSVTAFSVIPQIANAVQVS